MSLSRASVLTAAVALSFVAASPRYARAEPTAPEAQPVAASSSDRSAPGLRTAGLVSLGVGAALIVGGVVIALSGLSLKSKVDGECPGKVCPASATADLDSLRGRAAAVNVFWIAGAVTAVSGIALIVSSGSGDRDTSRPQRGAIVIRPAGAGVSAAMTF